LRADNPVRNEYAARLKALIRIPANPVIGKSTGKVPGNSERQFDTVHAGCEQSWKSGHLDARALVLMETWGQGRAREESPDSIGRGGG